jgi:hypothetical protein
MQGWRPVSVTKSIGVKIRYSLAEYSKKVYSSKRAVLPMIIVIPLSLFCKKWANTITVLSVCVSAYPPLPTFELMNRSSWNLVCVSWHLTPSQRRSSSVCQSVSICVSIIAARQRLSKNVTAAKNTGKNRRIVGRVVFYAVSVIKGK